MKKVKRALLGTAIAGAVVVGASAGTFAWFNASYTVSGEITNHTLTINDELEATEELDFDNKMLAPGRTVNDSFSIKNTGSMEQILRVSANLGLYDDNTEKEEPGLSEYILSATVYYNGKKVASHSGNAVEVERFLEAKEWHPNKDGKDINFMPEDEIKVDLEVKLKESAGNEYQGKMFKGEIKIEARQTDAGSEF